MQILVSIGCILMAGIVPPLNINSIWSLSIKSYLKDTSPPSPPYRNNGICSNICYQIVNCLTLIIILLWNKLFEVWEIQSLNVNIHCDWNVTSITADKSRQAMKGIHCVLQYTAQYCGIVTTATSNHLQQSRGKYWTSCGLAGRRQNWQSAYSSFEWGMYMYYHL